MRQKGDMKQAPHCGHPILYWPVNVTVIWRFPFSASEVTHIFVLN